MKLKSKNNSAFTLIELLVVIAIIGVLATTAVISLSNPRVKSRDAKRLADVKTIQVGLQMYFNSMGFYPTVITAGNQIVNPSNSIVYLEKVPSNPEPRKEASCANSDYIYERTSPTSYNICFCLAGDSGSAKAGINKLTPDGSIADCGCKITDKDGNQYDTVKIGSQCWMQQNLRVGSRVNGSENQRNADAGDIQKYCYDDEPSNCVSEGGLYQWHTAMALPQDCDTAPTNETDACTPGLVHQGICPIGWHIPNETDWQTLSDFAGGDALAGKKLKAKSTSVVPWNGTDNYGFVATPGGQRGGGNFIWHGYSELYWSTQRYIDDFSYSREIISDFDTFDYGWSHRYYGFSVRCLKD
ncbi:MAG: prepilin-type N-terminal cleavage/methylation domain-containing protein [Candidatus Falkowbacteria bacterium]|nr:prepilin-type N-terminal cleavage/methylation domain-containing protein [Candidatus Falkowbacteria bacterium]